MTKIAMLFAGTVLWAAAIAPAAAQTVVEQWDDVKPPPAPKVEPVTVNPQNTALLMLDFVNQICGRNPRCVASLPKVAQLLKGARDSNTMVVYSVAGAMTIADTMPEVKPLGSEPVVASHADKFLDTDLLKILKDKNITTVIVVGTAANGAVLYTGSHAALEGFNVIVPVDGMSATPYAEQYVAWNFLNAPGVSQKSKLTEIGMVKY